MDDLCPTLGIKLAHDLGRYLRAPMLHQSANKNSFSFILDLIKFKYTNWNVDSLLFAGKMTLAQSSINLIPDYVMQTLEITMFICEEAEKLYCNFIWGSTN